MHRTIPSQPGVPALRSLAVAIGLTLACGVQAADVPQLSLAQQTLRSPDGLRTPVNGTAARSRTAAPVAPAGASVYFEDFNSVCAAGAPAQPFSPPAGWTVHNVDGRTPSGSVAWVTSAWVVRDRFAVPNPDPNDCAIWSTSWYSPAGAANDWAVIPTQVTPQASTRLSWSGLAPDASYPDGYEVRYSTASTAPADFLANPPLLSVPAEAQAWTTRELSLAALAGTPVHLAFRNNSNDMFLLAIDNVRVFDVFQFDPALTELQDISTYAGYSKLPAGLGYTAAPLVTARNAGSDPLSAVQVEFDFALDGMITETLVPGPIAGLAAGASQAAFTGAVSYEQLGIAAGEMLGAWSVRARVDSAEGDQEPANSVADLDLATITVEELSRAQGPTTGTLGIGAGNGGELGQDFELPEGGRLTAVRYRLNNVDNLPDDGMGGVGNEVGDFNGYTLEVVVHAWDTQNNRPGERLAIASYTVPMDAPIGSTPLEFMLDAPLDLPPGRYLIAALEPTQPEPITLALENTPQRFTPGTVWVRWPTVPSGNWTNVETFGASFERSFQMTAILEPRAPFIFADSFED